MELILAILIFGLLGAFTIYGYRQSEQSARERERGDYSRDHPVAMSSGQESGG